MQREGAPDVLASLVGTFLKDAPPRLATMREAIVSNDARQLAVGAHALKGSCWALGASRLGDLCGALEALARASEMAEASEALTRIEEEYDRVEAAFRSELDR